LTRVLLLATTTGYQIRSFGEAAHTLGVRLMFASDRCDQLDDPWWDQAIPVRFHDEVRSLDAILASAAGQRPDGIIAVGDRPTILAALAAEALGLPGNPPPAARASRNKLESRAALIAAGLYVPSFQAVPLDSDPRTVSAALSYPAVLKPLALSGSRGVIRVDDADGFVDAFARLRQILAAPDVRAERDAVHDVALVESFVPGREYAIEGILDDGRFRLLAIFDKPDPLDGPFFEETIYVTPPRARAEEQDAIVDAVRRAAAALGLRHGPVHAECRVVPDDGTDRGCSADLDGPRVYVLEVAARPIGGLCSRALRFANREGEIVSLEEVLLRHAIGEDVSGHAREPHASGVMMIPIPRRGVFRRVHGVEDAQQVDGVEDIRITAKPDAMLVPLPEGRSYLGFIFARGDSPGRVERALRKAHARLEFVIEKELTMIGM
jgi:biotin carboxylase